NVVGQGSGMEDLRDLVVSGDFQPSREQGTVTRKEILEEYVDHLTTFVNPPAIRPFTIIADAGNGAGGVVADELLKRLPQISYTAMYFEPDGRFPNHEANPFEVENVHELIERIPRVGADFGVAWDGDADRVFFFDENGSPIPGDFITALI